MHRPAVSVIVPFRGSAAELADVATRLGEINFLDDDELIIAWNSGDELPELASDLAQLRLVPAPAEASSYYARNVGVRSSHNRWLLFIDADCQPATDILDAYFAGAEHRDAGIVAGRIDPCPGTTAVERYASSREHLDQQKTLAAEPLGYGQTANLLVERSTWDAVGGFTEGINSAGDADFCWRAQYVDIKLGYEPSAIVLHHHRQTVGALWEQHVKYGRGGRWAAARYPNIGPRTPPITLVLRAAGRLLLTVARGNPERIKFAFFDLVSWAGMFAGWFRSNAAPVIQPRGSQTHEP